MTDLIDRAALLEKIDKKFFATCPEGDEQLGYLNSRNLIRTAPAVDAVPVVRCKDCKYFSESGERPELFGFCQLYPLALSRLSNGFCDMGKRRTDEVD